MWGEHFNLSSKLQGERGERGIVARKPLSAGEAWGVLSVGSRVQQYMQLCSTLGNGKEALCSLKSLIVGTV